MIQRDPQLMTRDEIEFEISELEMLIGYADELDGETNGQHLAEPSEYLEYYNAWVKRLDLLRGYLEEFGA